MQFSLYAIVRICAVLAVYPSRLPVSPPTGVAVWSPLARRQRPRQHLSASPVCSDPIRSDLISSLPGHRRGVRVWGEGGGARGEGGPPRKNRCAPHSL